jgi:molecular chaperone Hsp33
MNVNPAPDDLTRGFVLEGAPVSGRVVRLGPETIDPILNRHTYPPAAAALLGEALALAALVGASMKFDGRLMVQAEGEGPIGLLAAEYSSSGALRGMLRIDQPERVEAMGARASPRALLGAGALRLSIDQGPDFELYQGIAELDGDSLAACAERWFEVSEQVPSRLRLAVGQAGDPTHGNGWRAGGILIQRVAGDAARGDTDEDWSRARILFDSVRDDELLDPALDGAGLAFRLFHEEGLRVGDPGALLDACSCSRGRLQALLGRHPREEIDQLLDPEGLVTATCQFCARVYRFEPSQLIAASATEGGR